jgi:hypothetical protein
MFRLHPADVFESILDTWEEDHCCGDPLWVIWLAAGMGSEPDKSTTCCTCSHGRLFSVCQAQHGDCLC